MSASASPISATSEIPERLVRETDRELGLSWLLKLRWVAALGQLVALIFVHLVLALELPYLPLLALVLFTALSNAALTFTFKPTNSRFRLPAVLIMDVVVLTMMLAWSGGASNPFTVFFLVHVALASLLLEARLAWTVVALTVIGFGALFFVPPSEGPHAHHDHGHLSGHLVGMWVAYVLSAGFVAYFVGKVSRAIRDRDRKLSLMASLEAQNERLATLSSFSANAAHELGSPLATIGLAAKELALAVQHNRPAATLLSDAHLIVGEIARCREILTDLSARAGESIGEMPVRTNLAQITQELERLIAPQLLAHLTISFEDKATETTLVTVPTRTLVHMLHNLIRNAFEAQNELGVTTPIALTIGSGRQISFHVLDRGGGLAPEIGARLGEPFVTTKSSAGGLGLGVYLARTFAERIGGHLRFHARLGGGTDVELCLAQNALGEPT